MDKNKSENLKRKLDTLQNDVDNLNEKNDDIKLARYRIAASLMLSAMVIYATSLLGGLAFIITASLVGAFALANVGMLVKGEVTRSKNNKKIDNLKEEIKEKQTELETLKTQDKTKDQLEIDNVNDNKKYSKKLALKDATLIKSNEETLQA